MSDERTITCQIEKLTRNYTVYKDGSRSAGLIVYAPRDGQHPRREITVTLTPIPDFEAT